MQRTVSCFSASMDSGAGQRALRYPHPRSFQTSHHCRYSLRCKLLPVCFRVFSASYRKERGARRPEIGPTLVSGSSISILHACITTPLLGAQGDEGVSMSYKKVQEVRNGMETHPPFFPSSHTHYFDHKFSLSVFFSTRRRSFHPHSFLKALQAHSYTFL